jgi:predicted Fe-Mo cluster-binding NifX family protein
MMLVTYIHWIKFDKAGFCHDGVRLDSGMYFYINEINKQQIMSFRKIANQEKFAKQYLTDQVRCILYLEINKQQIMSIRKIANKELKDKAACILYLEFCNQSYRKFAK